MAKRIESVDIAKGIAIICIVLGHLGFRGPDGADCISRLVFQFHVPIFFVIAGYFLSLKGSFQDFVRAKAIRLILPYLFSCGLMLALLLIWKYGFGSLKPTSFSGIGEFVIAALYGAGSNSARLPEGVVQIGAIWFLEALFVALIEIRLCLKLRQFAFVPVLCLFIVAVVSSNYVWLPLNIQSGFVAGFYVYLGYAMRNRKLPQSVSRIPLLLALLTVVVIAYYASVNVSLVRAYLGPYYLGIPVSVASSCFVIILSDYITKMNGGLIKRFLVFFGQNSLAVLCMHIVLLNCGFGYLLGVLQIPAAYNIRFFVFLVTHLSIGAAFAIVAKKSRLLSKIF